MKVTISTPEYQATYNVAWLEINTPTGNYVIQKGHAPTIMNLSPKKAVIFRLQTGKQENITVKFGVVYIDRTSATIVMTPMEQ